MPAPLGPAARAGQGQFQTCVRAPAARYARVVQETFALKTEGVGNAGRPMHPQPRVRILVASMHTSIHSEPPEITRHSRTQWFTAYTVLLCPQNLPECRVISGGS